MFDDAVRQLLRESPLGPQRGLHLLMQLAPDLHQLGVFSLEPGDDLGSFLDGLLDGVLKFRARDAFLQCRLSLSQPLAEGLDVSRVQLNSSCSKAKAQFQRQ